LKPCIALGTARGGREARFRVPLGKDHQERRGFRLRLAVDQQRGHRPVRIEFEVLRIALRAGSEIHEPQLVRGTDFKQSQVHHHARSAG
jgi:hypothetical protein